MIKGGTRKMITPCTRRLFRQGRKAGLPAELPALGRMFQGERQHFQTSQIIPT